MKQYQRIQIGNQTRGSLNRLFNKQRGIANRRGLPWLIEFDAWYAMVTANCFYCNSEPLNAFRNLHNCYAAYPIFYYSGIDRVDNSKGYVDGNMVPCCKRCNVMKSNMTIDQFADHIKAIVKFRHELFTKDET